MVKEYATIGGARAGRENRRTQQKPTQVPLSPPQIAPVMYGTAPPVVLSKDADIYKSLNLYRTEN
jgi:hypothetical protein